MRKERFKEIVSSYSSTPDEIAILQKLVKEYPFSQIVHLLLANASKKEDPTSFKESLTQAAFHSTDRIILKSLIENNLVPSEIHNTKATLSKKPLIPTKSNKIDADALRAEVLENLHKLVQTKKDTSFWFEEIVDVQDKTIKPTSTPKSTTTKDTSKSTTTRVKKQSKIIDKFIKEKPTIRKNSKAANEKEDLAISSSNLRDDVVSESLAKIFINQGKNEKAIDIYKKLIWKFPQKKALFAAQIEILKKK